jgi:DNA-binding response OmpR family regulator
MMSPCILVIHDDVKLLIKLEASLNQAGYRVLTAHDVRQGVHLAQAALPEVILYDGSKSNVRGTLTQVSDASVPFIPLSKRADPQELVCRVNSVIRSHTVS